MSNRVQLPEVASQVSWAFGVLGREIKLLLGPSRQQYIELNNPPLSNSPLSSSRAASETSLVAAVRVKDNNVVPV